MPTGEYPCIESFRVGRIARPRTRPVATAGGAMTFHRDRQVRCGAILLSASLLTALASVAAEPATRPPTKPAPAPATAPGAELHAPVIKDVYRNHFLIGTAGDFPGNYSDAERALAKAHFNALTPENCMKPALVHPEEDTWRFERTDALMKFAEENGLAVFGHTLVWHAQTNDWFFKGGDKAVVTQRLKDHIHTLVGRYKGRIIGWDVVNEAINDRPDPRTENLRNSQWLQTLGPEFLTLAFKFAHEADPKAKLYYNDYNIEAGAKHESSMILLRRLIKEGAPIHGVGIQGHWSTRNVPYDAR